MKENVARLLLKLCVIVVITTIMCGTAQAIEAEEGLPKVVIEPIQVESADGVDGTLELGMNVDAQQFQSAAIVLRYDNTRIELLDWSSETPIVIPTGQQAWLQAVPVPAAHSVDMISARPTLAYKNGNSTYLLFAIESTAPIAVKGRIATVRFRCVGDETGADMEALLTQPDAIGREGAVLSLAPKTVAEKIVSAAVQCTVVREGMQHLFTDTPFDSSAAGETMGASWEVVKKGPSVAQQKSGAVTFLDWDGAILETAIVSGEESATESLRAIIVDDKLGIKAALAGKLGYEFDCWLDVRACEAQTSPPYTSNNDALDRDTYQNVIVTGTNLLERLASDSNGIAIQAAYKAKRDPITGAYSSEFRPTGGLSGNSNYVFDFANIIYDRYGGVSEHIGKYSVTVPISRIREEDGTRYGVERIVQMGARISMKPKDKQRQAIFSYQALESGDEVALEMVPTKDMEYLSFEAIDTNGASTWINARARSGTVVHLQMKDVIPRATAHYVFRQARLRVEQNPSSEWDKFVDEQTFKDINGGEDVVDVEQLKAGILAKVEEQLRPKPTEPVQRSAALPITQSRLSVDDELDFILGLIDAQTNTISCTIESYDEKKEITVQVSVWDKETQSYVDYISPEGKPIISAVERVEDLGGGLFRQKLGLSLRPGVYKTTIYKSLHVPIEIVGFEVSAKQGESSDIEIAYADANKLEKITAFYIPCGDVNDDQRIRIDDYQDFIDNAKLGTTVTPENNMAGYDLNGDGRITMADLDVITSVKNLGKGKLVFQVKPT